MSDIPPIVKPNMSGVDPHRRPPVRQVGASTPTRPSDKVEFSTQAQLKAQMLERLADMPPVRQDLVDRVKAEIEAGNYDTPDKIDAAFSGMAEDLGYSSV